MNERANFDGIHQSIADFAAGLQWALIPAMGAIESFTVQLAASFEVQSVINAYSELIDFDWHGLKTQLTLVNPERWDYETLIDWGKRLERAGLFDKYEFRLMYGKEVWRAMLHSPVWFMRLTWEWVTGLWR